MTDTPRFRNPIRSEVDLDANGKHAGYLRVPHSVHRSAYGWIPVPIVSIRNGSGPVVLVMAGNHGDEYEGQIVVSRIVREIDAAHVRGQLIFLPMANFPAADAGTRVSPIDGGNLNRSFPGDPAGVPTAVIADYIEHTLLPRVQYLIDLHSGGSSLLYQGGNLLALEPRDAAERARVRALLAAFGLPRAFLHAPNPVHASSAARRQGALSILTELGGGGMSDPALIRDARRGLLHFLGFVGALRGPLVPDSPPATTRFMRVSGAHHYVYAYDKGLYEPLVELGARVRAGQPAALIHFPDTPLREPVTQCFASDGEVVCKRVPAQVQRGDCLFQLAEDDAPA
ncbi:succinylglutamate desuccinylase/aspartoacylase family protein [Burkholderia pseudomallei]|nr:succinylglutamate desuccinylase/aspartoacylase family protein [Burkholderia pseudomallei]CAJ4783064.1 succinylglutamate desuccinylase/aspartoacylase family protein [Burkholderia pseudomallei]CAJ5500640.1 succinylglutamate desuccinylase/aspartoacylase family protein [Burkholderia pseudomallei]CAJ5577426.1 succinylglutamate desuccinylase/aspartoacylase family protein [Burkholderia pseudomallei]CAJ7596852.1 succinylglutamate desuccinylase/aspartoacylase family protein [Burkholderia pseudomallei